MPYDRLLAHRCKQPHGTFMITWCTDRRRRLLAVPSIATEVKQELLRDGSEFESHVHAFVIMPDHIHWLVSLAGGLSIDRVVASVKARASRRIRSLRSSSIGSVWEPGFHDRWINTEEELKATARYIIANPLRAGLTAKVTNYPWWFAEWAPAPFGKAMAAGEVLTD
jgi:putative transposase